MKKQICNKIFGVFLNDIKDKSVRSVMLLSGNLYLRHYDSTVTTVKRDMQQIEKTLAEIESYLNRQGIAKAQNGTYILPAQEFFLEINKAEYYFRFEKCVDGAYWDDFSKITLLDEPDSEVPENEEFEKKNLKMDINCRMLIEDITIRDLLGTVIADLLVPERVASMMVIGTKIIYMLKNNEEPELFTEQYLN